MAGPTLTVTVSPAVESKQSFHSPSQRPASSLADRDLFSDQPSLSTKSHQRSLSTKSLPSLPGYDVPSFDFDTDLDTSLSFPAESLKNQSNENLPTAIPDSTAGASRPRNDRMGKRRTFLSRPQSWMPSSNTASNMTDISMERPQTEAGENRNSDRSRFLKPDAHDVPKQTSSSFANFARRSWIASSRSPSPGNREPDTEDRPSTEVRPSRERSASNSSIMRLKKTASKRSGSPSSGEGTKSSDTKAKLGNIMNKMKSRPQAVLANRKIPGDPDSPASSIISLAPPSTNTRKSHASETSNSTYPEDLTPVGKSPQVRDPLWSAFKSLDTDYSKFQTKLVNAKLNVIRTLLVPFLRKYAFHPSNKKLHHEDLERRAGILNKWWAGLLELLDGKTQQPLPGADRPVLLDAVCSLMTRPEWRQCSPTFTALLDRSPQERVRRRSHTYSNESSSSVESTDSAYLAESAKHNVKTMFTTNLLSQMAIVVEKLSLRHAPESLISFAGKACAYAFFFAPGVADVLVRLWGLTPDLLRRIANEFHLPMQYRGESDDIVALFPPMMDGLGWTSVKALSASLKQPAHAPLAANKISWRGPWVSRWNGRDSDLFFIFCKYYFVLAEDFIPYGLPLVEKARAPAFVVVSAQLLAILDSTIHRQATIEATGGPPLSDVLHGADASLMTMQLVPNNSNIMRGMNENRLIVLLKDILSGASVAHGDARHTFAETFNVIMKAAAKRTSQFNHNACFTICDFLEESLVSYNGFSDVQRPDMVYVDWPFWFDVCKKILESNNSMSEIRVLSLIFSIWDTISSDHKRKESVCMQWLLSEEAFEKFFNNWCPMVRAYYMRLVCWRICRDAGSPNDLDLKIFMQVSSRLKTVWSHFLWLKQSAENKGQFPPSTAPSFPTPGKRFMIIRTEVPTVQQGLIAGLDSGSEQMWSSTAAPATDFDAMDTVDSINYADETEGGQKKKGGLLGKLFSFSGNTSVANDLDSVRRDTVSARSKPALPPKGPAVAPSASSDTDSLGSSPIYEETQFVFRFTLSWNATGTISPPNRILTRPRLPNPAQSRVSAKAGCSGSSPLPAACRPAATRAVSGSAHRGLVESARNANTSEATPLPRIATNMEPRTTLGVGSPSSMTSPIARSSDDLPLQSPLTPTQEPVIMPVQPKGSAVSSVKYAGRALAEWSLVVAECNSFIDRRRDEGVLGLSDVEVPSLGVEGFRKIC
ncbi:DUF1765-domain-containing protein [Xylariaceae sp. FL0016]|nr:DUF1765-domain-containing protein [Xylariaceae sp. FL0016]